MSKRGDRSGRGRQLGGPSRRLPAQLRCKDLDAVRGPSLAESMSQYLIDRIEATDNIEVLTQTEIVALYGSPEKQLERVRWRNKVTGEQTEKPIRHVFLFIGADPATTWLKDSGIALDAKNFILTGSDVPFDVGRSNVDPAVRCRWNERSRCVRRRRCAVWVGQAGGRGHRRGSSRCRGTACRSRNWRCRVAIVRALRPRKADRIAQSGPASLHSNGNFSNHSSAVICYGNHEPPQSLSCLAPAARTDAYAIASLCVENTLPVSSGYCLPLRRWK